ncbi:hypothetical protein KKH23_10380, partial [Patescibacteria group bacterium]|nr:hypothetical protein [Patescibacteria group bacterium]
MVSIGFHTTRPVSKIVEGLPVVEMTLRKGSPQWAMLIPLIPTLIIGGLIAFGITRIESISKAILPLTLVAIGGVVILAGVLTRRPVMEAARSYVEKGGRLPRLARTIPKHRGTDPEAIKVADRLGLSFDGFQFDRKRRLYQFTVQTGPPGAEGITFYVEDLSKVEERLGEKLKEFNLQAKTLDLSKGTMLKVPFGGEPTKEQERA